MELKSKIRRIIQMMPTFRLLAGMAEVVKGAGLKIRSQMGSWVRIPLPALKNDKITICHFSFLLIHHFKLLLISELTWRKRLV